MLQVFCLDVAKVDVDVVYTCMLQAYVSSVSGVLYVCLQVFYLDVAYVCNVFQIFFRRFSQVFQTLVSSVLSVFFCMLQLLHLMILKLDWVLHMGYAWEAAGGTDDIRSDAGNIRGDTGPLLVRSLVSPMR